MALKIDIPSEFKVIPLNQICLSSIYCAAGATLVKFDWHFLLKNQ